MMKKTVYIGLFVVVMFLASCKKAGPNSAGSEYMPDMGHSIAYEANYYNYYYNNTWGSEDEYYEYAKPKLPVTGTVPRDLKNKRRSQEDAGTIPYDYVDTEDSRALATANLINNPYPISDDGLARGKDLYNTFCAICHGTKGDGAGYLVRDDGGVYPVQPAILINEEFTATSNGRLYHAIMYGKNLMGGYADKMNSEERWQVVHWIRALQAKEQKAEYNQLVNTLNAVDQPAGSEYKVLPSSYDPNAVVFVNENHGSAGHDDHHGDHHNAGHDDHHGDDHGNEHGDHHSDSDDHDNSNNHESHNH